MLELLQHKILIFQTLKGSQRSDLVEIRTNPRYCSYPCNLQEWRKFVTCKNGENLLKNNARVATTQNNAFSNTQGQLTPQSEIGSS